MKVLILGGTGPMGEPIVQYFADKGQVYVTSRSPHCNTESVVYYLGDAHSLVFMKEIVLRDRYDIIVDFMKYTTVDFCNRINILLDATDHYVFISSGRVYADKSGELFEDDPRLLDVCQDKVYLKSDEYALNKARCENALISNVSKNWTIVRPYITFNTQRLQLGVYEKEHWLKRYLTGHTVIFPMDIASKITTLTYGYDVALHIAKLALSQKSLGQIYNVTGSGIYTWKDIISIYNECLIDLFDHELNIKYVENSEGLCSVWNRYQILYDRIFSRQFNNSKQEEICGKLYVDSTEALKKCVYECLKNPQFIESKYNWSYEGWSDKVANEFTSIRNIHGCRNIAKYLKHRFF